MILKVLYELVIKSYEHLLFFLQTRNLALNKNKSENHQKPHHHKSFNFVRVHIKICKFILSHKASPRLGKREKAHKKLL